MQVAKKKVFFKRIGSHRSGVKVAKPAKQVAVEANWLSQILMKKVLVKLDDLSWSFHARSLFNRVLSAPSESEVGLVYVGSLGVFEVVVVFVVKQLYNKKMCRVCNF